MKNVGAPWLKRSVTSGNPRHSLRTRPTASIFAMVTVLQTGNGHEGSAVGGRMSETSRGRVRVEPGAKRLRVYVAGHCVADTVHPVYVWESPAYPTYYFPRSDV